MAQIIAGIYQIEQKIGAGGGGTVYAGRHLRLNKQVVLKADKRKLGTKPEILRREVDMLKNLSHTYIPQVYDFVQEDGIVYTVMDYIDGESLDKLLVRGQKIPQPMIVHFACQLLKALVYLHGRPPHGILHGDIKPANIMLRPSGDICLIDYNIALALGEDGAVKVGFSRGYASPEHYGANYLTSSKAAAVRSISQTHSQSRADEMVTEPDPDATEICRSDEKVFPSLGSPVSLPKRGSSGSGRGILLDVRSDIYSLGATLYHLLSGNRPAESALEVLPLGGEVCNPAISKILQKAMAPQPEERFQTAQEMLDAFLQLPQKDSRTIRHKRRKLVSAAVLGMAFLFGGACSFVGLKQLEQRQGALALAEYSANALAGGDVAEAVHLALQAIPSGNSILEAPVTAQAQKALTDALGVYDLSDGFKAAGTVEMPSAPFKIAISPNGTYLAAVYAYQVAVFGTEQMEHIVSLPIRESALSDVVFLDETRIVYAGDAGVTLYDVEAKAELWRGGMATTIAVSEDSSTIATVDRDDDYAVFYDAHSGKMTGKCSFEGRRMQVPFNDTFADAQNRIFSLNGDGSLLAVSFTDGGLMIFDRDDADGSMEIYDKSVYISFAGGFCGKYFAFAANGDAESLFGLLDVEKAEYLGDYTSQENFLLRTDGENIYLADGNLLVRFDPETRKEIEIAHTENEKITAFTVNDGYVLAATDHQSFSFYDSGAHRMSSESGAENVDFVQLAGGYAVVGNRNEASLRFLKLEGHKEENLLSYDARYQHDEARIAEDGESAMLFCYRDFRIYDMEGKLLKQVDLPDADRIYDQQFRKNGKESKLEVMWYDGTTRYYSAADGSLLSEESGKAKDKNIKDEFYTNQYKIISPLHGAPEVYDAKSGKLEGTLEEDAYLTYVTQVEDYIITEYISSEGERYGLLLDENLQTLAYLPKFCDLNGGKLVFDYEGGDLRQCRLYSLKELRALGEEYLIQNEKGGA